MENYDELKARLTGRLNLPRAMKPQTRRQLNAYLSDHGHEDNVERFLLAACELLEDFELEILFAPQFTPDMDDKTSMADVLYHWKPTKAQLNQLTDDLCADISSVPVLMDDGSQAKLPLHEVMVERFIKLLRMDCAPRPSTSAALRDALPAELWPFAIVAASQRGFTNEHQLWFAEFVNHINTAATMTQGLLDTIAQFIASQRDLSGDSVIEGAQALLRAVKGKVSLASSGQTYWSVDVAQHHQYRGEGKIDQDRVKESQQELEWVELLVDQLKSFEFDADSDDL